MSEDALTWNMFVGLWEAGALRRAAECLTGRTVLAEPELFLWGTLVSTQISSPQHFGPLEAARARLEAGIGRFKTEPDIMLVVNGKLLILIETKFCSGNPLAHAGPVGKDEKPADRAGLLARYYEGAGKETKRTIDPEAIGKRFHSQLFRNIVFASEMAADIGSDAEWHVVNLVSSTQAKNGKESEEHSFLNAEQDVQSYLQEEHRRCFTSRTWEDLHRTVIRSEPDLAELDDYMSSKSAHFRPAFALR